MGGGDRRHPVERAATLGIDVETAARTPGTGGFTPIPKRWAVERTHGLSMLRRSPARDRETPPDRSGTLIHIAVTDPVARGLTGENAVS
ncbi:hypothetical protein ACWDXD_27655 [Streptomyces sp. NPDC003314]